MRKFIKTLSETSYKKKNSVQTTLNLSKSCQPAHTNTAKILVLHSDWLTRSGELGEPVVSLNEREKILLEPVNATLGCKRLHEMEHVTKIQLRIRNC